MQRLVKFQKLIKKKKEMPTILDGRTDLTPRLYGRCVGNRAAQIYRTYDGQHHEIPREEPEDCRNSIQLDQQIPGFSTRDRRWQSGLFIGDEGRARANPRSLHHDISGRTRG